MLDKDLLKRLKKGMEKVCNPTASVEYECTINFMIHEKDTCKHCEYDNSQDIFRSCNSYFVMDIIRRLK